MITIIDVAQKAGVSVTTVSRVINNSPSVSREKREKVLEVIQELNYQPLRKSARGSDANLIVVITGFVLEDYFSPLKKAASEAGYQIVFYYLNEKDTDADIKAFISQINPSALSGVILSGFQRNSDYLKELASSYPVVVLQETSMQFSPLYISTLDDYQMSSMLTQHMIDIGKKHIVFVGNTSNTDNFYYIGEHKRIHGFLDTLELNKIPADDNSLLFSDISFENGYTIAKRLLESNAAPDAAICTMSPTCMGMMSAFQNNGLDIPGDIALATFTNDEYLDFVTPGVTSVLQGTEEICGTAIDIINEANQGKYPNGYKYLSTPELIVRGSTLRK